MHESKYSDVELPGDERVKALDACKKQLTGWRLIMPDVTPLVLDFGLGNFYVNGLIEYWVANEREAGYCGKFLFLFDGQECPYHHHTMKHETFFVVRGSIEMNVDGRIRNMKEGDLLTMRPGEKHSFRGLGAALLLEVSRPSVRGDNFFQNKNIGDDGVM
jgi:N-acetylneuraminate synthase